MNLADQIEDLSLPIERTKAFSPASTTARLVLRPVSRSASRMSASSISMVVLVGVCCIPSGYSIRIAMVRASCEKLGLPVARVIFDPHEFHCISAPLAV
jgi:hypothetical protein